MPVENRDWRDPFVNPAADAIETGGELFRKAGASGKSCASCHDEPETAFKRWGATMPKWDGGMKRMIGVEEFIYRHGAATTGEKVADAEPAKTSSSPSICARWPMARRSASSSTRLKPRLPFARGEALTNAKIGQLNLSCQDCHSPSMGAGHWMRGQYLGEMKGQITHFPVMAHQPRPDLGYPPPFPVVQRADPRQRSCPRTRRNTPTWNSI